MKILIVGGGGREHALAWKAAASKLAGEVLVAPGNAGTACEPGVKNVAIAADDITALAEFAAREKVDLTIVGPEQPLVAGVADLFTEKGLACFGPSKAAAKLEGSKTFARELCAKLNIPAPAYASFTDATAATKYLAAAKYPLVIKADGLAAGKGVRIVHSRAAAVAVIEDILIAKKYGGARVVVEEFIHGEEVSFIALVAGVDILPLATSQDHKAAGDGDTGPNTGGMGAVSPAAVVDAAMHARIMREVMHPVVRGLAAAGIAYTGFLYAGLMVDKAGCPRVLEFNCRLGDPETQPILLRLKSDLIAHCTAAMRGELRGEQTEWDPRPALGVVIAAAGYPGVSAGGDEIHGLPATGTTDTTTKVFHSATAVQNGKLVTAGGRVACATALGDSVRAAHTAAYKTAAKITWRGSWYRRDIGHRAVAREKNAAA